MSMTSDHEQTLREMAAKLEVLAHDDECRAAEDDIDEAWRQSRLDSAHDLHQRRAACLSGADALVRAKRTCWNCKHCEVICMDHGLCRNPKASAFDSGVDLDDGCIKGWATRED